MEKLDYASLRKQFLKVIEKERFFTDAFERVLKMDDFDEYRRGRKEAINSLNSYAGATISETMIALNNVKDPRDKLKLMAPVYTTAMEVIRDYGAFDRSLTLPNSISDRYTEKLKRCIKMAVKQKTEAGLVSPAEAKNAEAGLLYDLMSPANFLSLESTKFVDYLTAFKNIRAVGGHPLDKTVLAERSCRQIVESLAKYNACNVEKTFASFAEYSDFIGKEDEVIEKLMTDKEKLKAKRAYAEEYVISGMEKDEKCCKSFRTALRALDELRMYEGFEDPQRHTFGDKALLGYLGFMEMLAKTMGEALGKPLTLMDLMKVSEVKAELEKLAAK